MHPLTQFIAALIFAIVLHEFFSVMTFLLIRRR